MEEIFVPAAGMALEEVALSEWLKQPGDEVEAGEAVAVVETDKAMVELTPQGQGRLGRHLYQAGDRIPPGTTVAWLLAEGEAEPEDVASVPDPASTGESAGAESAPAASPTISSSSPAKRSPHTMSPRQRRERSGAAASPPPSVGSSAAAASPTPSEPPTTPPTSPTSPTQSAPVAAGANGAARKAMADLVVASWTTTPHFSVGRDVDGEALLAALERARQTVPAATVTDFLLLALARAVRSVGQAGDVGLAVATEAGVVIPVLRDVAGAALASVTRMRRDAIDRARTRHLISDDAAVPFATLSNLGAMGVSWFTGVIPLGQTALVTIGELAPRPVVEGRGIAIRTRGSVAVTADHRRYDGADSARLLGRFARAIEEPDEEVPR